MHYHIIYVYCDNLNPSIEVQLTRPLSLDSTSWTEINKNSLEELNNKLKTKIDGQTIYAVLFSNVSESDLVLIHNVMSDFKAIELSDLPVIYTDKNTSVDLAFGFQN